MDWTFLCSTDYCPSYILKIVLISIIIAAITITVQLIVLLICSKISVIAINTIIDFCGFQGLRGISTGIYAIIIANYP